MLLAAWSLIAVWTVLAMGGSLAPWIGRDVAVFVSFAAATAFVVATRRVGGSRERLDVALLGLASGFAAFPAWAVLIVSVGMTLGLQPRASIVPPEFELPSWIAVVVLAPIFEELLYRERVLPALRARFGLFPAIVASSALFALPHLEAWQALATFLVGLMLASVYLLTRSIGISIAIHAGLNLAYLACGVPPIRCALTPGLAALVGTALVGIAVLVARTSTRDRIEPTAVGFVATRMTNRA